MKKKLCLLILTAALYLQGYAQRDTIPFQRDTAAIFNLLQQFQTTPVKKAIWNPEKDANIQLRHLLDLKRNLEAGAIKECIPDTFSIRKLLIRLPFMKNGTARNKRGDALVSDYAFRKLIKSDFNSLILGNDNIAKLKRYASLDLSEDPAFSFSPFTFESDAQIKPYKNILALNISGKLNPDKFYNLSKIRDLSYGFSWVHVLNLTNYKPNDRAENIRKKDSCEFENKINKFTSAYWEEFEAACDGNCITPEKEKINSKKLREKFYKDYADFELEMMEDYWQSKNFWWFSLEGELARDKVDFVSAADLAANNYAKKSNTIFTPALTASLNYFTQRADKENSFFTTLWVTIKHKHSLSEILEPETFQPFHKVHDSLYQLKDPEDVFITDFGELSEKNVLDFGIRLIGMIDISGITPGRKKQVGLSYSFSRKGLVNDKNFASLFRSELGLVLPFLKPDGKSTFNLEIFRRWDNFSNFSNENDRLWGVRFNVPIN